MKMGLIMILLIESQKIQLSNALFFVGAVIICIGVLVAYGGSETRTESWRSLLYWRPGRRIDHPAEELSKELKLGIILMIVGAVSIALSAAVIAFA